MIDHETSNFILGVILGCGVGVALIALFVWLVRRRP